jgi:hypothetical protein
MSPQSLSKICALCLVEKPICEFYKNRTAKDGFQAHCKICDQLKVAKWRADNPLARIKATERTRAWAQANKAKANLHAANYRAAKLRATPTWANFGAIAKIYADCPEGMHVDHIVPLVSDLVCGLHWEGNLQYLTELENLKKSNCWWPDMP